MSSEDSEANGRPDDEEDEDEEQEEETEDESEEHVSEEIAEREEDSEHGKEKTPETGEDDRLSVITAPSKFDFGDTTVRKRVSSRQIPPENFRVGL